MRDEMARHRFFVGDRLSEGVGPLSLTPEERHHALAVLRVRAGEVIVAVDPEGVAHEVRVTAVSDEIVMGEKTGVIEAAPVPRVWLIQGIAKGDKMDAVVRQSTEIGVERIIPFASSRCVVRLEPAKADHRRARWQRIAAEAAKQSQQSRVPEIAPVADLADLEAELGSAALVLVAWEEAVAAPGIRTAVESAELGAEDVVAVVVGPEGGLSADEVASLVRRGARTVSLGPSILRTETAGVVCCALTLAARGGLGGG